MARKENRSKATLRPRSTNPAEWAAAVLGALLVASMVGFLTWYGFRDGGGLPDVVVETVGAPEAVARGYRQEFIARNVGGGTASQLHIEGELRIGQQVVERSETTLNYLPGHSRRSGGLFFQRDPREGQVEIRATGYEKP